MDIQPPLTVVLAVAVVIVVGVAGASAPNPESKLGFLAVALLQFFIPLAEDDAIVIIFP